MSYPKISENEILIFVDKNIIGFYISMCDAIRVDYRQCFEKLFGVSKGLIYVNTNFHHRMQSI